MKTLSPNHMAATAFLLYVVLVLSITTIAIPTLDSVESDTSFFWATWAGVIGGKIIFLVFLVRHIDHYSSKLGQAAILVLLVFAMLGCFYLYFNARMGTGVFA